MQRTNGRNQNRAVDENPAARYSREAVKLVTPKADSWPFTGVFRHHRPRFQREIL